MSERNWLMLDAAEYSRFQKNLIKEKGNQTQKDFLNNLRAGQPFLDQIDAIPKIGSEKHPVPSWKMATEKQFAGPPADDEAKIFDHWADLTPSTASQSNFWAQATIDMIRAGCIAPMYLVGEGKLTEALRGVKKEQQENEQQIDRCVRTALRRMSGLQHVRANRSVFSDCTLARAWWRERLFRRVAGVTGKSALPLGKMLRRTATHWEKFVDAMVSRSTVFGNEVVQNAFVASLANLVPDPSDHRKPAQFPNADWIQKACQRVCVIGGSVELPVLEESTVQKIIRDVIEELAKEGNRT